MIRYILTMIILFQVLSISAQKMTVEQYIEMYKELAMEEMIRSGVPASITLAQGILEAEYGNSRLAREANNHFGIKCKETWTGPTIRHTDDAPWECFRKYESAAESYRDHSEFLRTRKHYAFLFDLDLMDYKGWAYGLKKAGYATNPKYPAILIGNIEKYNLQSYSLLAMKKKEDPYYASKVAVDSAAQKVDKAQLKIQSPVEAELVSARVSTEPVIQALKYPDGVFEINSSKVIYARKGTPWMVIAEKYNIALHHLFDFNDSKEEELIQQDQLVFLNRKRKKGSVEYHTVIRGETLKQIAQMEGIRLASLLEYNHLSENESVPEGKILFLQEAAPVRTNLTNDDKFNQSQDKRGGK